MQHTSKLINNPANSRRRPGKTRAPKGSHLSHPIRSWSAALRRAFFGHLLGHPPRPKCVSDRNATCATTTRVNHPSRPSSNTSASK
ncbi:hypothetical protein Nepgr_001070 [Nepenthes gracilis]|uniref:Uncharacterized protein n=1 Tax=Nepenthes gracilis TaxID=150966 RepID=A0AAD3P3S7_NEPGR|nr:hypothetical protein Nepgr_001070 [Nepenthes gracilis]